MPRRVFYQLRTLRRETGFTYKSPAHCRSRQPQRAAIISQTLQHRVRRRVIALAGIADGCTHRAEQHKVIQRKAERFLVQVPRAKSLWLQDPLQGIGIQIHHRGIMDHRRGVKHSPHRRQRRRQLLHQAVYLAAISNITREH